MQPKKIPSNIWIVIYDGKTVHETNSKEKAKEWVRVSEAEDTGQEGEASKKNPETNNSQGLTKDHKIARHVALKCGTQYVSAKMKQKNVETKDTGSVIAAAEIFLDFLRPEKGEPDARM